MALGERARRLRDACWAYDGIYQDRYTLWLRGYKTARGEPEAVRVALAYRALLEAMPVEIPPDELLAGRIPKQSAAQLPPEEPDPDDLPPDRRSMLIAEASFSALERDIIRCGGYSAVIMNGHMAIDNETVLTVGLEGIRARAKQLLRATDPGDPERLSFYRAAIISLDSAMMFAARYADLAASLAATERHPVRRAELETMAANLRVVPARAAETFHQALQAVWLMHFLVAFEESTFHGCFCPGRLDRYAWPLLERDLAEGRLTREQALELVHAFFIKLNEFDPWSPPQQVIIGGRAPDGSDWTNELTYLCLQASRDLRMVNPSLSLDCHAGASDELLADAAETVAAGDGYPAFFNGEIIVRGLEGAGVAFENGVGYVPCSCTEITVGGMSNPWVASGYVNFAKALELALNGGVDPLTGLRIGAPTPALGELASFDAVQEATYAQVRHLARSNIACHRRLQQARALRPLPLLSCVVRDCLERGKDINRGAEAARYAFLEPEAVGVMNVADSLAAIRQFVFEEKALTLRELVDALRADFAGDQTVRQMLLHRAPKFGNDDDRVDAIARQLTELWHETVQSQETGFGGRCLPGYLCWQMHMVLGGQTGATPDGRRAREPLGDGVGPVQGRDRNGPTAVVGSISKLDLTPALGGVVHNLRLTPQSLRGESRRAFVQLLRTLFERGGVELQVNVVSPETLRQAQEAPEQFANLIVRVAGYSANFVQLDPAIQEEVIARTTYELGEAPSVGAVA